MSYTGGKQKGFTIVELLIVVVVIAILAAITVVAYTGVSNKANDSVIQSDLNTLFKKIRLLEVDLGKVPPAGGRTGDSTSFPLVTFAPSKKAYDSSVHNLSYCEGTVGGIAAFAITAKSKSGNVFSIGSLSTMQNLGKIGHSVQTACAGMDVGSFYHSYGYYLSTQAWWAWANY